MSNVIDFNKAVVKETSVPFFPAGSIVAAKVGSPNMLVMFDSGEAVEVLYVDPMRQEYHVQASFPVEDMYLVFPAAVFDQSGRWSTAYE